MNLSNYIIEHIEPILQEWENFAKTKFPLDQQPNVRQLRDHAKAMLLKISADLSHTNVCEKKVLSEKDINNPATLHGADRMESGLDISDVISEFRALRASVIKFFTDSTRTKLVTDPSDLVHFHEAIDEALTTSINNFVLLSEKQRQHFNKLLCDTLDFNYILDLNGNITYMNKAMASSYNLDKTKILGNTIYNNRMPAPDLLKHHIQTIINNGTICEGEVCYLDFSGKTRYSHYALDPIYDKQKNIKAIAGVSHDITKGKESEALIWERANFDLLTGCANKQMFVNKLDDAIKNSKRSNKRLAVLFIDLDNFKNVNDKWGHNYGDWLLKQSAKRIKACIRAVDIIARWGGDEFAIILIDVDNENTAQIIAQKILAMLRKPFQHQKKRISISASIGIALSPKTANYTNHLLSNADKAMYMVKKEGRNNFKFYNITPGA